MKRRAGIAIVVGWLIVIGAHVRREYFRPEAERIEAGARSLAPGSYFYIVHMAGTAIGTASVRLRDTADSRFIFEDQLLMDVPALDTVHRAVAMTRIELGRSLGVDAFTFRLDSKIGSFAVSGTAADSMLDVIVEAGSGVQRSRIENAADVLLDAAVPMRLAAAGRLVVGSEHTARVFDPSSMTVRDVTVRVSEQDVFIVPDSAMVNPRGRWVATALDTVPVWRIDQEFGGMTITSWVDEDGLVVRAESPLGLRIERTAFELARQAWAADSRDPAKSAGYGALIESTAIASSVDLRGIGSSDRFEVRLTGVDLTGFDLSGGRQILRGDTLVITRESGADLWRAGWLLPWTGGGEAAEELAAEPLIQSDDARIIAKSQEIIGETRDAITAAGRLNEWVYGAVRKEILPSVPSAVQVLEALRGDCNEHTVLFVALARAAGLPARTAVGLVHLRGRFYYHAWPEVWAGDAWIAVDPTLGQFPADASHIRFITGGLARQVELIRLIGRLRLETA
ncbi:MAG: transglutaminase-like domain-containing protein [Gemmatimonadetes bacterium]|nr:transglutaminase-like domain-containing protein [Gemmatimonadota bacterium]